MQLHPNEDLSGPPGCGTRCKACDKEIREFCWLNKMCSEGFDDIGPVARKEKRRGKSKSSL